MVASVVVLDLGSGSSAGSVLVEMMLLVAVVVVGAIALMSATIGLCDRAMFPDVYVGLTSVVSVLM